MQEAASSPVACDHFLGGYLSYQRRQPEGGLVAFLGSDCAELFGQTFSTRGKKLSSANLVASRHVR